jgi:hypothetical protein
MSKKGDARGAGERCRVLLYTPAPTLDGACVCRVVILGGHIDSIASGGATGRAPGADDDASGSSTVLEVFRSVSAAGFFLPNSP